MNGGHRLRRLRRPRRYVDGRASRRRALLATGAAAPRIGLGLRRQKLERDLAAKLRVIGQVDFGHAARAELGADDVATELQTWGYCNHSIRSMRFQCPRIHRLKNQQPLELRNLGAMEP